MAVLYLGSFDHERCCAPLTCNICAVLPWIAVTRLVAFPADFLSCFRGHEAPTLSRRICRRAGLGTEFLSRADPIGEFFPALKTFSLTMRRSAPGMDGPQTGDLKSLLEMFNLLIRLGEKMLF